MRKKIFFLLIYFIWCSMGIQPAAAQERYVLSGKVTDAATGEAILYANVVLQPLSDGNLHQRQGGVYPPGRALRELTS